MHISLLTFLPYSKNLIKLPTQFATLQNLHLHLCVGMQIHKGRYNILIPENLIPPRLNFLTGQSYVCVYIYGLCVCSIHLALFLALLLSCLPSNQLLQLLAWLLAELAWPVAVAVSTFKPLLTASAATMPGSGNNNYSVHSLAPLFMAAISVHCAASCHIPLQCTPVHTRLDSTRLVPCVLRLRMPQQTLTERGP